LADLPAPPLYEVIPHFHDTARRFTALETAIAADACTRVKAVPAGNRLCHAIEARDRHHRQGAGVAATSRGASRTTTPRSTT